MAIQSNLYVMMPLALENKSAFNFANSFGKRQYIGPFFPPGKVDNQTIPEINHKSVQCPRKISARAKLPKDPQYSDNTQENRVIETDSAKTSLRPRSGHNPSGFRAFCATLANGRGLASLQQARGLHRSTLLLVTQGALLLDPFSTTYGRLDGPESITSSDLRVECFTQQRVYRICRPRATTGSSIDGLIEEFLDSSTMQL